MALTRRPGRTPIILVLTLAVLAVAAAGCGSSGGGDQTSARGTEGPGTSATQQSPEGPTAAKADRKATAKKPNEAAGSAQGGMHPHGGPHGAMHHRGGGSDHQKQTMGQGHPQCPGGSSKAECKARIEAQKGSGQAPGQVVSSPSDCTQAMSEAQCKEVLEAQKAAAEEPGKSVSPQTCLQEYSREFCEKHFGQQAEQQQAGK